MKKLVIYASLVLVCLFGTFACEEPSNIEPDFDIATKVEIDSMRTANCTGTDCDPPPCPTC